MTDNIPITINGKTVGVANRVEDAFYPDLKDVYELDDATLASVMRWGKIFEDEMEKKNAEPADA